MSEANKKDAILDISEIALQMQRQRMLVKETMESKIEETIEIVRNLRLKGMINRKGSFEIQDNLNQLMAQVEVI